MRKQLTIHQNLRNTGQRRGLSKCLDDFKKSIVTSIIYLLISKLYNSDPYNNKCKSLSVGKFLIWDQDYIYYTYIWHCKIKCNVVYVAESQSYIRLVPSLKLWRTLCSFRWLNFILNPERRFTPYTCCIAKKISILS